VTEPQAANSAARGGGGICGAAYAAAMQACRVAAVG